MGLKKMIMRFEWLLPLCLIPTMTHGVSKSPPRFTFRWTSDISKEFWIGNAFSYIFARLLSPAVPQGETLTQKCTASVVACLDTPRPSMMGIRDFPSIGAVLRESGRTPWRLLRIFIPLCHDQYSHGSQCPAHSNFWGRLFSTTHRRNCRSSTPEQGAWCGSCSPFKSKVRSVGR